MTTHKRRSVDTLRDVDDLLSAHLQDARMGGRPLANLAAAMAIEYSGADRGALLLDSGDGLEPVLALESDLSTTSQRRSTYDHELIEEARTSLSTRSRGGSIAAPVLLDKPISYVLYLEGSEETLGEEAIQLANGIATRIGTLLRSASLVEELSRRTENVTTLEALGACLTAGELQQEHLDRTVDGALTATQSDDALLALVDPEERLLRTTARGSGRDDLLRAGAGWFEAIRRGAADDLGSELEGDCIVEPLWADLVPNGGGSRRAVGLLAIRRRPAAGDYGEANSSFFRAVAHLLSGALARREYFNRAAEDPLTETGSRLALQLGLSEARERASTSGRPFSLILVDIDDFKGVNDRWGHPAGDKVLRELAAMMRSRLRATDSVSRYGGDEFVLILPETDARQSCALAEELRALIGGRRVPGNDPKITISIGVATSPTDTADRPDILSAADRALYRSKSLGRNRVTHHDELPAPR